MSTFLNLFGQAIDDAKIDQGVDSLFKQGAGPVDRSNVITRTEVYVPRVGKKERVRKRKRETEGEEEKEEETKEEETKEETKEEEDEEEEDEEEEGEEEEDEEEDDEEKESDDEDLEAKYYERLSQKDKSREENKEDEDKETEDKETEDKDTEDKAGDSEKKTRGAKTVDLKESELEKAERTVFVGNVTSQAITSKAVFRDFKKLFEGIGEVESVRFRSIAFDEAVPRKVAFVRKSLHLSRDSVNAYVVFKDREPSRKACAQLNGHVFDEHHIRVDHVAHPAPKDNKRTIFVGNLDFEEKEETLWRYFNSKTDNDVELVRVVRDSKTNVGKGFALVQFKDSLSVNKALLLNDKAISKESKRKLRISRAKAYAKPSVNSPNYVDNKRPARNLNDKQKTKLGRAQSVLGKADRATAGRVKKPADLTIEGQRALKGSRIAGIKGLKSAKGHKKPRIRERSTKFRQERDQMAKERQ